MQGHHWGHPACVSIKLRYLNTAPRKFWWTCKDSLFMALIYKWRINSGFGSCFRYHLHLTHLCYSLLPNCSYLIYLPPFCYLKIGQKHFLHITLFHGTTIFYLLPPAESPVISHSSCMENNNINVYLLSSSTPSVHCAGHPTNVHQDEDKNRSQPGQRGPAQQQRGNCSIHYFRLSELTMASPHLNTATPAITWCRSISTPTTAIYLQ